MANELSFDGMPQKTRRPQRIIDVIYDDVYEIPSEAPSPEDILLAKEEAGLLWS